MKLRSFILINCIVLSFILFVDGIWLLDSRLNGHATKRLQNEYKQEIMQMKEYQGENRKRPVNILILGLDDEEVRSDVIILMNYDHESGKLNMISIPRDTRVNNNGRNRKINSLIGINGESLVISKVEELTTLPVHYYITLNFEGFRKVVDILDGVEINVPFDMNYDDPEQNLHIHLKKGYQVLDGKKAEQFVRYRKGNRPEEGYTFGDLGRIKEQQNFIKAMIEQKVRIKYLSKADEIFFVLKEYMNTNIEIGDINYYMDDIMNLKLDKINSFALPGDSVYKSGVWYFIHDEQQTEDLIKKNFSK